MFGGHVGCRQPLMGPRVQRRQRPRAAEVVQPIARHRRGGAGSGTGVRAPEPYRVGVARERLARRQPDSSRLSPGRPLLLGKDLREQADPG